MDRYLPLRQTSRGTCVQVKLTPVEWFNFTMPESHFLGQTMSDTAWYCTWKAILHASGVPYNGSTDPAQFLLSKQDDHALAVMLRATMLPQEMEDWEIASCVTGQPIFARLHVISGGVAAIEIVYPSQLTKKEALEFSVRDKPLEVIEYKAELETGE